MCDSAVIQRYLLHWTMTANTALLTSAAIANAALVVVTVIVVIFFVTVVIVTVVIRLYVGDAVFKFE